MLKLILFLTGLAGGVGGATSWLLSQPEASISSAASGSQRLEIVKRRLNDARAEGKVAATETENRVRHEFEAYRRHPDRPGTSS